MNDILQSCGDSLAVVDFWAIRCKQCLTIAPVFDVSGYRLYSFNFCSYAAPGMLQMDKNNAIQNGTIHTQ